MKVPFGWDKTLVLTNKAKTRGLITKVNF